MKTSTINLAIPDQLLRQADEVAKRESRNRSELMRQALRMYLERRKNWDRLFAYADAHVARLGLKPADVADAVHEARQR
jgi:Arc/MetJ-type ribon-helix-helix transcriptional regulator